MILKLDYSNIEDVIGKSNKLCNEYDDYSQALKNKVQKKIHNVDGGMSSNLNNADYFINTKIRQIDERESEVRSLGRSCETLLDTAKRVDKNVADTIKRNQNQFFSKNPELKPSTAKVALYTFWTDLKKTPLIGIYLKAYEATVDALSELKEEIVYWWECNGVESVVMNGLDIVIKVGVAALAIIGAVIAVTSGAALVIIAAAIVVAAIATVDAIYNLGTSISSMIAYGENDYAMAKIYSRLDKYSQVIRFKNYHDKDKNRNSFKLALGVDIAEAVASTIMMVNGISKSIVSINSRLGTGFAFKEIVRTSGGMEAKVTMKSFINGSKALVLNSKLTSSTSAGLRTTMLANFKSKIGVGFAFKELVRTSDGLKAQTTFRSVLGGTKALFLNSKLTTSTSAGLRTTMLANLRTVFSDAPAVNQAFNTLTYSQKLERIKYVTKVSTRSLEAVKGTLQAMDDHKELGGITTGMGFYIQNTFFDNDFTDIIKDIGLGKIMIGNQSSGLLKDTTGMGDGIIQKAISIPKNIRDYNQFKTQYPHFSNYAAYSTN